MAAVNYAGRVGRHLQEIADYIARDDPDRAETFILELRAACELLADFPRRFSPAPRMGPNARQRSYGNYVIFYDVGDEVTVTAILHAARDLDALDF